MHQQIHLLHLPQDGEQVPSSCSASCRNQARTPQIKKLKRKWKQQKKIKEKLINQLITSKKQKLISTKDNLRSYVLKKTWIKAYTKERCQQSEANLHPEPHHAPWDRCSGPFVQKNLNGEECQTHGKRICRRFGNEIQKNETMSAFRNQKVQ